MANHENAGANANTKQDEAIFAIGMLLIEELLRVIVKEHRLGFSNVTPCLRRFVRAFTSSHSNSIIHTLYVQMRVSQICRASRQTLAKNAYRARRPDGTSNRARNNSSTSNRKNHPDALLGHARMRNTKVTNQQARPNAREASPSVMRP